ncbi:MAG: DUF2254 domain-containing protein [Proteobacteria bacterium]|nr:DUF2254 domain-containing protein [Pseudomonadota bacterium]
MGWLTRYRLRSFLRHSFWLYPSIALLGAWIFGRLVGFYAADIELHFFQTRSTEGARAVVGALAASMLTFVVYSVSALLLAVQLASGQITPRLINLTFGRWTMKAATSAFVFAFCLSVVALANVSDDGRYDALVLLAVVVNVFSLIVFLWFVQEVGTGLRPVAILQYLYAEGRKAMDGVYEGTFDPAATQSAAQELPLPSTGRVVVRKGASGTFLAFGRRDLVALAIKAQCTIELIPQVGDFVSTDDPLARIYPATAKVEEAILNDMVAFGPERTMEQDPMFAFRIMVDIGARALSPAINDPTTAVLAIDQIHRLLRYAGFRNIGTGRVYDRDGRLRLIFPTPAWDDIVDLALTELRQFGGGSIQVARRTKAMLEHLIATLPPARTAALRRELVTLESGIARNFAEPDDRRRANFADFQGLGGSSARSDEL